MTDTGGRARRFLIRALSRIHAHAYFPGRRRLISDRLLAERVMRAVELDPRQHLLHRLVQYLHGLHARELKVATSFAIGYGMLELVRWGRGR